MNAALPTNPPERRTAECGTCGGAGDYIEYSLGELVHDGECAVCEGTGEVRIYDAEVSAPDTWKEAEGIA